MLRIVPRRYSSIKAFAYLEIFDGERLIAVVRQPPNTIPSIGGLQGEQPDHWRVDCVFDPAGHRALKQEIATYLGTDKVSLFPTPDWVWRDQSNTEPYVLAPGEWPRGST